MQHLAGLDSQRYQPNTEDELGQLHACLPWGLQFSCACGMGGVGGIAYALLPLALWQFQEIVHLLPACPSASSQLQAFEQTA